MAAVDPVVAALDPKALCTPCTPSIISLGPLPTRTTPRLEDPKEMPSLHREVLGATEVWWSLLGAEHAESQQKSQEIQTLGIMEESVCCFANLP